MIPNPFHLHRIIFPSLLVIHIINIRIQEREVKETNIDPKVYDNAITPPVNTHVGQDHFSRAKFPRKRISTSRKGMTSIKLSPDKSSLRCSRENKKYKSPGHDRSTD